MTPPPASCDSCGADSDDLLPVHRAYVTPAAWDQEEKIDILEEVEHWCVPCRTHYPHQELGASG